VSAAFGIGEDRRKESETFPAGAASPGLCCYLSSLFWPFDRRMEAYSSYGPSLPAQAPHGMHKQNALLFPTPPHPTWQQKSGRQARGLIDTSNCVLIL
jgi:hypothetical protein